MFWNRPEPGTPPAADEWFTPGRFLLTGLWVAALAAAQLLPFLDLLAHSQRDKAFGDSLWSMPAWGWANLLVPLEEIDARLALKVGKVRGQVGEHGLKRLNKTRPLYRQEIYQSLKRGRSYVLDPHKNFVPKPPQPATAAVPA